MQQHKSLILVSHTLVAAVLRPFRNWLDSGLSRWLGPAEEYGASFPPSGSKTTTTVTRVEAMTIQLRAEGTGVRTALPGLTLCVSNRGLTATENGALPEPGWGEPLVSSRKFLMSPRLTQGPQRSEP